MRVVVSAQTFASSAHGWHAFGTGTRLVVAHPHGGASLLLRATVTPHTRVGGVAYDAGSNGVRVARGADYVFSALVKGKGVLRLRVGMRNPQGAALHDAATKGVGSFKPQRAQWTRYAVSFHSPAAAAAAVVLKVAGDQRQLATFFIKSAKLSRVAVTNRRRRPPTTTTTRTATRAATTTATSRTTTITGPASTTNATTTTDAKTTNAPTTPTTSTPTTNLPTTTTTSTPTTNPPTTTTTSTPTTASSPPPTTPPVTPTTPSPGGWAAVWASPAPSFSPTRTLSAATVSDLSSKIAAAQNGDLIVYTGATIPGEFTVTRQVPGLAVVDFGSARFTGTAAGSQLPAVWINGAGGLRFVGGDISNAGGDGLLIYDAAGFEWWGFKVHDTGGQGVHLAGITRACDRVTLRGEITNAGLDLSQDPHAEKGTGLHAFYSGGSAYPVTNGNWTLDIHDQPNGAAMQINRTRSTHIALRARNITFVATQQVGGNALQFWATSAESSSTWNDNITVDYVEADNVARVVETNGMEAGSLANSTLVYGRGANLRKTPGYAAGMNYQDAR